jgi:hypothetical protein
MLVAGLTLRLARLAAFGVAVLEEDREGTAGITGFVCFVVTTMFVDMAWPGVAPSTLST